MRLLRAALPMLVLGALAALGQAPWGAWWASIPALALILHLTAGTGTWRVAAGYGFAAGAGYFAMAMFWIVEPFFVEPERYGWMAPFALIFLALGGGLFWAAATGLGRRVGGVWAIALAFVLSDWLRGWIFTGLPWALLGHSLIDTPLLALSAFGGPLLLTAIVVVAAALAAMRPARGGGALLALALMAGLMLLAEATRPAAPPDTATRLRILQPNIPQARKWDPAFMMSDFTAALDLAATPGPRDLVLWPETAVSFLLERPGAGLEMITQAGGAPTILGIQRMEGARFYNSLAVLGADGRVQAVYDKAHLVPFGEYIPFGDALAKVGISAFAAQAGAGYSPGPGPVVLDLPAAGQVAPQICYEDVFPGFLRAASPRPDWVFNATNDAWFGHISGPWQHLAQARLRAAESGLPMVRAANTGISAVIDARGQLRASLPLDQRGVLDVALPAALPATLYARLGDWPLVALALAGLVGLALRRRAA